MNNLNNRQNSTDATLQLIKNLSSNANNENIQNKIVNMNAFNDIKNDNDEDIKFNYMDE